MYFAARKQAICWIFGIMASVLTAFLMYRQSLPGSAALNMVYGIQGIIGYINWNRNLSGKPPAYRLSWMYHLVWIGMCFLVSFVIYKIAVMTGSADIIYLDIFLATGCILATFLEIRKDTACWWYWMTFNVGYAGLYWWQAYTTGQSLYLYGLLMLALAVFSFFALKAWEDTGQRVVDN